MTDVVRLSLEFEIREPFAGRLSDAEGQTRAFSSWLGLFAALEEARRQALEAAQGGRVSKRSYRT